MRLLGFDRDATEVLFHSGWDCVAIPLEAASAGVACALPSGVIDVIADHDQYTSEDVDVEIGETFGEFSAGSGQRCNVRFSILPREEFGDRCN